MGVTRTGGLLESTRLDGRGPGAVADDAEPVPAPAAVAPGDTARGKAEDGGAPHAERVACLQRARSSARSEALG